MITRYVIYYDTEDEYEMVAKLDSRFFDAQEMVERNYTIFTNKSERVKLKEILKRYY